VTYFWNGNNSQKFNEELEEWQEIPSDRIPFEHRPRMKADQVADALISALESQKYHFLRVNFANGDMVGHTGVLQAAVEAMEAVDENVGRLVAKAESYGYSVIITADHGNCDQMIEIDKKTGEAKKHEDGSYVAKTSHTLNPVPFLLTGEGSETWRTNPELGPDYEPGLTNLAATVLTLLGFEPPAEYRASLVVPQK
jgi:2,3-bisphosphoglycerate-independent phosphoglycerate mutase